MTTCSDAISEARSLANGSAIGQVCRLTAAYSPGDSTISVSDTDGISKGTARSVGRTTLVAAANPGDSAVEVLAGVDGSPLEAAAIGTLVWVKPRFTTWSLWQALRAAISEMNAPHNGLYGIARVEPAIDGDETALLLPEDASLVRVLGVRQRPAGGYYENTWNQVLGWSLKRDAGALGQSVIRLNQPVSRSDTVEVIYATAFTMPTLLSDDLEETLGLSSTMLDIPSLLIAARALGSKEGQRVQMESQGDARRAGEVRESANAQSGREFRRMAEERIRGEALSLLRQHGIWRQT